MAGLARNLVLAAASTAVALGLAELAFRGAVALGHVDFPRPELVGAIHRYADDPELVYELKPSARGGPGMRTNAFGLRGPETTREKPEGVTRIAVLGDSVTFGFRLPYERTFVPLFEGALERRTGSDYEILNFSVTGYNSAQEERVLVDRVVHFEPDFVLLGFFVNDDSYSDGLGEMARELHPKAWGSRLHSRLLQYLLHRREMWRKASWKDFAQVPRLFERLRSLGEERGFRAVVLLLPPRECSTSQPPEILARARKAAAERGLAVVDLWQAWRNLPASQRDGYFIDDEHLSPRGMRAAARELMLHGFLFEGESESEGTRGAAEGAEKGNARAGSPQRVRWEG